MSSIHYRRVTVYGKSLGISLPRGLAEEILSRGSYLCVDVENDRAVFKVVSDPHVCGDNYIKIFRVSRKRCGDYYAMTIPKLVREKLGIAKDTIVVLELRNGVLLISPLPITKLLVSS